MAMNRVTVPVSNVSGSRNPVKKNSEKQAADLPFLSLMNRFHSAESLSTGIKGSFSGAKFQAAGLTAEKSKRRSDNPDHVPEKKKEKQKEQLSLSPAEAGPGSLNPNVSSNLKDEKSKIEKDINTSEVKQYRSSVKDTAAGPAQLGSGSSAIKRFPPELHSGTSVSPGTTESPRKNLVSRTFDNRGMTSTHGPEKTTDPVVSGKNFLTDVPSGQSVENGRFIASEDTSGKANTANGTAGQPLDPHESGTAAGRIQDAIISKETVIALDKGLQMVRTDGSATAEVQAGATQQPLPGMHVRSFSPKQPTTDQKFVSTGTVNKPAASSGSQGDGGAPVKKTGYEKPVQIQPPAFGRAMNKVELWMTFQNGTQPAGKELPVPRQVSDRISEWLAKSSFHIDKNSDQTLTMTLHPEQLGRVTITLTKDSGGIVARLATETKAAKDLLESGLVQLRQDFASRGIPVAQIDVTRNGQTLGAMSQQSTQNQQPFQGGSGQSGGQEKGHRQKQGPMSVENEEYDHSFLEWLTGGI